MHEIILQSLKTSKNIKFKIDVKALNGAWSRKNVLNEFIIGYKTSFGPPFEKLFLKKWNNLHCYAHNLFVNNSELIPNSPEYLGYFQDKDDTIYVFENLENEKPLKQFISTTIFYVTFFDSELCTILVNKAFDTLRYLDEKKFYFADFSYENILINFKKKQFHFIDLDSSLSFSVNFENAKAKQFDKTWYCLLLEMENRFMITNKQNYFNITAFLIFALSLKRAQLYFNANLTRFVTAILNGDPIETNKIIRVFMDKNYKLFNEEFPNNNSNADILFDIWNKITTNIKNDQIISWELVENFWMELFLDGEKLSKIYRNEIQNLKSELLNKNNEYSNECGRLEKRARDAENDFQNLLSKVWELDRQTAELDSLKKQIKSLNVRLNENNKQITDILKSIGFYSGSVLFVNSIGSLLLEQNFLINMGITVFLSTISFLFSLIVIQYYKYRPKYFGNEVKALFSSIFVAVVICFSFVLFVMERDEGYIFFNTHLLITELIRSNYIGLILGWLLTYFISYYNIYQFEKYRQLNN